MAFEPPTPSNNIDAVLRLMADLRAPDGGCPWDLEQTHASIARYAIEEAYEVVDAIEQGDDAQLKAELGDLLLQTVFHAQMADERGAFCFEDVCAGLVEKMVRRHPHVYGTSAERSAHGQTIAWEEMKAAERAERANGRAGILDDVPVGLPALTRAEKLMKRAARVGFDWPDVSGVIAKIREELAEVEEAITENDPDHIEEELGDLLSTVANLTRFLGVDGETALRKSNAKFARRFAAIEASVQKSGKPFSDHTLAELDRYWEDEKKRERRAHSQDQENETP